MARNSILVGVILVALGVVATIASDSQSVTSYIPSFIGIVFIVLGAVATAKPDLSHHMMHGAAAVALLAILGSLGSLIGRGAGGWALISQLVTVVVAGGFLVLAIQSFKAARAARTAS